MTEGSKSVDRALILTAIPVEYTAVRAHLTDLHEEIHANGTIYERGTFSAGQQSWEVFITELGAGNDSAAVGAERAISYAKPDIVLFVGVAGGIKDVQLGDVVVATKVYGYEFGKVDQGFKTRPSVFHPSFRMEQRAKAEAKKTDWLQWLQPLPESTPKVYIAPIAAGNKVIASTRAATYKLLRSHYNDTIAVEMEGHGFLQAVYTNPNIEALLIRGISDLIDDKAHADAANFQQIAARHASAFAFEILVKTVR
jgi:nucleoside phosphorylase